MRLRIADVFSDHMVLRHSRPNPVWGEAEPGAAVAVRLGGKETACVADDAGRWLAWIDTPPAGIVARMEVEGCGERVAFEDVACGEVWLAGGQSNMEQPLMCVNGARPWVDRAGESNVRLKRIPRRCGNAPEPGWHFFPCEGVDSPWERANSEGAATFSAIGFVFGAMLSEKLSMPVGLIECDWGGTPIQAWLPSAEIMTREDTRADLAAFMDARAALGDGAGKAYEAYLRTVRQAAIHEPDYILNNLNDPLNFLREDRNIAFPPLGAIGDPQQPGVLYDHMVARVAPYGLSGVLWYQGEANGMRGEAARYGGLFARLADNWRRAWRDPALPFLTCQLAPFDTGLYWKDAADWPELRAQQQWCADTVRGVSMAVLLDLGMERNIHPLEKIPVADRLCRLALEDVYGIPAEARAPRPMTWERVEDGVRLRFDGPIALRDGLPPQLTVDDVPIPTDARITAPCILELRRKTDALPNGASYAQKGWLVPALFGANGLPVAPFRCAI